MSFFADDLSTPSLGHTPQSSTCGTVLQTPITSSSTHLDASPWSRAGSGLRTVSSPTSGLSSPSKPHFTDTEHPETGRPRRGRRWASELRVKLEDVFARRVAAATTSDLANEEIKTPGRDTHDSLHQIFGDLQLVAEPDSQPERGGGGQPPRPSAAQLAWSPNRPHDPLDPLVFRYPHSTSVALSEAQIFTNTVPRPRNRWAEESIDNTDAPLYDPKISDEATVTARRIRREWEDAGVFLRVTPDEGIGPLTYRDQLDEIVRQRLVRIHDDIVRERRIVSVLAKRPRARGAWRDRIEMIIDYLGWCRHLVTIQLRNTH